MLSAVAINKGTNARSSPLRILIYGIVKYNERFTAILHRDSMQLDR